jgi:hypothetical protein
MAALSLLVPRAMEAWHARLLRPVHPRCTEQAEVEEKRPETKGSRSPKTPRLGVGAVERAHSLSGRTDFRPTFFSEVTCLDLRRRSLEPLEATVFRRFLGNA